MYRKRRLHKENRKTFDSHLSELLLEEEGEEKSGDEVTQKERRAVQEFDGHWLSVLDIDFFKSVNDNFGHVYGDEVLLIFSNIMTKSFRSGDILFRYGGEEFVVVLAPTKCEDATKVFERFRLAVEAYDFPKVGKITVSIGMASLGDKNHPTTILGYADEALYYAKGNGRNQVQNYHTLIDANLLKAKTIDTDVELF
ncbi:MAG: hypothetical protein A6F70_03770 [Cycloclasticus sp. symbiont of Bathymodiolus heckerae]|nr:MAG: hypothetical protein A6F70_03770 [Cycloclasticus sp. symbiont of Bathymodiolus heckerae]